MRVRVVVAVLTAAFAAIHAHGDEPRIPTPAPRIPSRAWAKALESSSEHPRLEGPRAHLRALAEAKPEAWQELRGQKALAFAAVVHAVEPLAAGEVRRHVAAALDLAKKGPTNVHQDSWLWLDQAAVTYDAFFEAMTKDERTRLVEWMNAHLESFTEDENAFHNSTLSKILTYLRIAYATWGENPRAREFRDHALVKLYEGRVVPVLRELGAGGGFTEAGWYARGSLWNLVRALELARRFEGYDGFGKAPRFFYQRLAYELHQPYPGKWTYGTERYAVEGDGSHVYGGHTEYPRHLRTVLAQHWRGSELSGFVAARKRKGSNAEARLVDFLHEEDLEARDLEAMPLAHLAAGIGKLYARSDWSDDATWLRFECGDYFAGHQHFEVGNLEIFWREPLITESGEYESYLSSHSVNWLARTIAHNCVLVHDPDEKWTQLRDGGRNAPYGNDGGQAKKWEWPVATLDEWKAKRASFTRGRVVAYVDAPGFCYVAGDATEAYSRAKLASWVRQVVFARPRTIVVLDRVVATRADLAKTWLLHSRNEPRVEKTRAKIEDGRGKLEVLRLLPEKAEVRTVEGYGYGGKTYDPPKTGLSDGAVKWRLEISPAESRAEDLFLHVIGEGADAKLVRKGALVGARVGDVEVLLDPVKTGGTLTVGGKKVALEAKVKRGRFE